MRKVTHYCDICGKMCAHKYNEIYIYIGVIQDPYRSIIKTHDAAKEMEVCYDCEKKISEFIDKQKV